MKIFFRSLIPFSAVSFALRASSQKDAAATGAMYYVFNLDKFNKFQHSILICQYWQQELR